MPHAGSGARRVLLVGWEAADLATIGPLADAGRMPVWTRLAEHGVTGPLAAAPPFACPLLWTSMVTGLLPDRHGILTFMEPDGAGDVRPVSSSSRRRKALWNHAGRAGLESLVIGWPVTYPAEPVPGVVVSERHQHTTGEAALDWPADDDAYHPRDQATALRARRIVPLQLKLKEVRRFIPDLEPENAKDPRVYETTAALARAASVEEATLHALTLAPDWSLALVHYDLSGLARGFAVEGPNSGRFAGIAAAAFELLDELLGELVERAGPDALVIVASDHGIRSEAMPRRVERRGSRTETSGILRRHGRRGVLLVSGPGVREDELVFGARTVDVAPLVLTALGLPVPADLDGRVPDGVFTGPAPPVRFDPDAERRAPGDGLAPHDLYPDPWLTLELLEDLGEAAPCVSLEAAAAVEACVQERHLNRAQIHGLRREFGPAVSEYRRLLDRDDAHQVSIPLVESLLRLGRLDEAEEELAALPHDAPDSDLALMMRARLALRRGDAATAAACLDRIATFEPNWIRAPLPLGFLTLRLKRWEQAIAFFTLALQRSTELSAGAHHGLGIAHYRLGRFDDAFRNAREAIRLSPKEGEFQLHYGLAAARTGRTREARAAFLAAAERLPEGAAGRRWIRRMLPLLAPEERS